MKLGLGIPSSSARLLPLNSKVTPPPATAGGRLAHLACASPVKESAVRPNPLPAGFEFRYVKLSPNPFGNFAQNFAHIPDRHNLTCKPFPSSSLQFFCQFLSLQLPRALPYTWICFFSLTPVINITILYVSVPPPLNFRRDSPACCLEWRIGVIWRHYID